MGIAGLLPALKPIQKNRHLSDFKGQTVAVDAYGWLHKGVYSCATELATGKPTHKYVDYSMYRVRLLRHFGIEPYIVFDGGPLPAKRGTETERKQRREENLTRGNALAAQGKHSQARECYVKCVDVTPQMAYQFIKALQAENVQYVVAPYEADAQMAYLERIGLVNAILTEDSDLLVFGCSNVLFKFDPVANTVCHISRADFGSVTSSSDSSSINLYGWNDTQFRAMAILSGCDYLPSITGIGLKTANNLLRKWKTAENVVKAVMLEGKKSVPNGYFKQFKLAERCFRFQRVYSPLEEKLVHLTEIEGEWDEETDAYIGEDIEPELAKRIAIGDADPTTRQPMKDINPGFKPRTYKRPQSTSNSPSRKDKGKGKAASGGILNFFGPNPIIPREKPIPAKPNLAKPNTTGTLSGKRTLGEVMDQDLAKRKERRAAHAQPIQSKFFDPSSPKRVTSKRHSEEPGAPGSSRTHDIRDNKENIYITIDDEEEEVEILSTISLKANVSPTQDLDFDFENDQDGVEQEEGYMSPFSTYSHQTQDLSSPARRIFTPLKKKKRRSSMGPGGDCEKAEARDNIGYGGMGQRRAAGNRRPEEDEFDVDPISSPVEFTKRRRSHSPRVGRSNDRLHRVQTPTRSFSVGNILVADTPVRKFTSREVQDVFGIPEKAVLPAYVGPDLRSCLDGEDGEGSMGGGDTEDEDEELESRMSQQQVGAGRPRDAVGSLDDGSHALVKSVADARSGAVIAFTQPRTVIDVDALEMEIIGVEMEDPERKALGEQTERFKTVAEGWRMKWALGQIRRDSSSSSSSTPTPALVSRVAKNKQKADMKKRRQSAPVTNKLRRSETNVTPFGRHSLAGLNRPQQPIQQGELSVPRKPKPKFNDLTSSTSKSKILDTGTNRQRLEKRSSLTFVAEVAPAAASGKRKKFATKKFNDEVPVLWDEGFSDMEEDVDASREEVRMRLNRFRCQ